MKKLCILTARGGSKRIPRKNIRDFLGKPMIAYPLQAALDSALFDTVMVSTEDHEIARLSRELGAEVPFLRSSATAGDYATTAEVVLEVLQSYSQQGQDFDVACCCYPTAPFVTAQKLEDAYNLLLQSQADAVIPVAAYTTPIQRALTLKEDRLAYLWPENETKRSQDLPPAYYDTGQFYFVRVAAFLNNPRMLGPNTVALVVPASEVQDIDQEEDWKMAELKYRHWTGLDR